MDISDIDKPYARKMENLALVRDGGAGEANSRSLLLGGLIAFKVYER